VKLEMCAKVIHARVDSWRDEII